MLGVKRFSPRKCWRGEDLSGKYTREEVSGQPEVVDVGQDESGTAGKNKLKKGENPIDHRATVVRILNNQ
jgi:hypothetical protein